MSFSREPNRFTPVPHDGVIGVKTSPFVSPLPLNFPLQPPTYPGYYEIPFQYGQVFPFPVMTRHGGGGESGDTRILPPFFLPIPIPRPPVIYPPIGRPPYFGPVPPFFPPYPYPYPYPYY